MHTLRSAISGGFGGSAYDRLSAVGEADGPESTATDPAVDLEYQSFLRSQVHSPFSVEHSSTSFDPPSSNGKGGALPKSRSMTAPATAKPTKASAPPIAYLDGVDGYEGSASLR